MLRRIAAAVIAGAVLAVASFGAPAMADYIKCIEGTDYCYIVVDHPGGGGGSGGNGGGGNGKFICRDPDAKEVDCFIDGRGWYNQQDFCWWLRVDDPAPPANDPVWEGHQPSEGRVYRYTCPYATSLFARDGFDFRTNPPPGYGGMPSPATLAAQAVSQMTLRGAQINAAPDVNGAGLVGLPVWLWTAVNADTWGPQSATASVPGLSVTATATASKIEWRMGDGHSITCDKPGTPYTSGSGTSPTCGYTYTRPSRDQAGGRYTITAVTTWDVTWAGGGQNGTLTVTRQSTSTLKIDELQVVTR